MLFCTGYPILHLDFFTSVLTPWRDVADFFLRLGSWTRTAISLERIAKELESVPIRIGSDAPRAGLIKVS